MRSQSLSSKNQETKYNSKSQVNNKTRQKEVKSKERKLTTSRILSYRTSIQERKLKSDEPIIVMKNLKDLGVVYAYRPQSLKNCLVNKRDTLKKYEYRTGECNLNNIFIKSAEVTFQEWREKIYTKFTSVINNITESDDLLDSDLEGKAKETIQELFFYVHWIKKQLRKLISIRQQSSQLTRIHQKYFLLLQMVEHVLKVINCIHNFNQQISLFLDEKKCTDINNIKELKLGITEMAWKFEEQIKDSLNYCSSHPDNKLLLKFQYKVKRMLKFSIDKVMSIFESIRQLQKYENQFKKQMQLLESIEQFSYQYLLHVLETLINKNQEIKIIQKKFFVNKLPQFASLRAKIQEWQTNFIKRLRQKTINYFKEIVQSFNVIRSLHLFKNKGKEYTEFKKILLLLVKVYQESEKQSNITAQDYELEKHIVAEFTNILNECIKGILSHIQLIFQQTQKLEVMRQKKEASIKWVEKYLEELELIEKYQSLIWGIVNNAYVKICRTQRVNSEAIQENSYLDKKCFDRFHHVLIFSRNEQNQNDIFKQLQSQISFSTSTPEDIESILNIYNQKYNSHLKFVRNGLQPGLQYSKELRELLKNELVSYIFQDEFKSQFITGYPSIKQLCIMGERMMAITSKQYIKNIKFNRYSTSIVGQLRRGVNQQIKKLEKNKFKNVFNRYIIFLYENMMISLLNMKQIHRLFIKQEKHLQPFGSIFHEYIEVYSKVLSKNIKEQSRFGFITSKIYEMSNYLYAENKFMHEYASSQTTNLYFPSISFFEEWLLTQFSAQIEETINKKSIMIKRGEIKHIFTQFISKLEVLRDKIKANKTIDQEKGMYRHIITNLSMLKQFNFEENYKNLLMKIIQYLRKLNISHSAIFTKDESPICVLIKLTDEDIINKYLLNKLNVVVPNAKSILTIFQMKFEETSSLNSPSLINKQLRPQIIQKADEMVQEIEIADEAINSYVEQFVEEIDVNLPISSAVKMQENSLLPQQKSFEKPMFSQNLLNQTAITIFNYYKLEKILNVSHLKKCLLNNKNEFSNLQSKLRLDILCQLFVPGGKIKVIDHLQQILKEIKENDFMGILEIGNSHSQCEEKIIVFQQKIQRKNDFSFQDLTSLCIYFRIETKVLYSQGNNLITSYKKQNENACFLYANQFENCYKQSLKHFEIDKILQNIWVDITSQVKNDSGTNESRTNKNIEKSNILLTSYYKQVQSKFNILNEVQASNSKEINEKIETFLQNSLNNKYLISKINNIGNKQDLVKSIGEIEKDLRKLGVLLPYYTFKLDENVLYVDNEQINHFITAKCLLCSKIAEQLKKFISFKNGNAITNSESLSLNILENTNKNVLIFSEIKSWCIENYNKQNILKEYKSRSNTLEVIKEWKESSIVHNLKMDLKLSSLETEINQQLRLFQFFIENDVDHLYTLEQYSHNQDIQCKTTGFIKELKYYNFMAIQKISLLLKYNRIEHQTLMFANNPINVFEEFSLKSITQWLSLNAEQTNNLSKNIVSDKNIHTINRLFIIFVDLIPTYQHFEAQNKQKINEFLLNSTIQIKSDKKIYTFNCLDLSKFNSFEVDVGWPKTNISFSFSNSVTKIDYTLNSNQYQYYAQVEPTSLQSYLKKSYGQIQYQYIKQKMKLEEDFRLYAIKKEQQLKQLQRIQQEKQLIKLRNERQMAKIQLETQEINRRRKQKEEEDEENRRKQEENLRKKLNSLLEIIKQDQEPLTEDILEFEMTLSQGDGERYFESKYTKQYNVEYDYEMTLYHYIKKSYHHLRKEKEIDHEIWFSYI